MLKDWLESIWESKGCVWVSNGGVGIDHLSGGPTWSNERKGGPTTCTSLRLSALHAGKTRTDDDDLCRLGIITMGWKQQQIKTQQYCTRQGRPQRAKG